MQLPVIDIGPLVGPGPPERRAVSSAETVGAEIVRACEDVGFFQVVGHGVPPRLRHDLISASRHFFALPDAEKADIAMERGGAAWRGWFPLGGELTGGVADRKEGIYFGTELPDDDPRVRAGRPLHGPNLFPGRPADLRPLVLEWMRILTGVGRAILSGMAVGLGLEHDWFDRWCADPTVLFRIFHYPAAPADDAPAWGVAEHTDYGLLTLLAQDDTGGLEVRVDGRWTDVPPVADAFVCNLGDMLERATDGRFRSTPHRVRPPDSDRVSLPLFLDPGWDVQLRPLPDPEPRRTRPPTVDDAAGRWDGASVFDATGTYGDYLTSRVARVFPELFRAVVDDD